MNYPNRKVKLNVGVATKKLHSRVALQLLGLPKPVDEFIFHPTRKWRLDYAWPESKVALEVHGATHKGGRHVTGKGFANDREKMNEAQLAGWIVIECTTDNISKIRDWLERALKERQ